MERFGWNVVTVAKGAGINVLGVGLRAGLMYAYGVIISRIAGPTAFGVYSIAFSLHLILSLTGQLGLRQTIVRYVAEYLSQGRTDKVKAVLQRSLQLSGLASLLMAVSLFLAADRVAKLYETEQLAIVLRLFAISLPLATAAELLSSFTQAFGVMRFKFLVQDLLRPLLEMLLGTVLILSGFSVVSIAIAYLVTALLGTMLLWRFAMRLADYRQTVTAPDVAIRPMLAFATPVLITILLRQVTVRGTVLLVGWKVSEASAGMFNAAWQTAAFSAIFLSSFELIIAPIISSLYHSQQHEHLGQLFRVIVRWMLTLSLPAAVLVAYLAVPIMSIFGEGFDVAAPALVLLVGGQFVNMSVGTGSSMLDMSGYTYLNMINTAVSFVGTLALNLWLIPLYGLIGAAIAVSTMTALQNLMQLAEVRFLLGIRPYSASIRKPILAGLLGGMVSLLAIRATSGTMPIIQYGVVSSSFICGYVIAILAQGVEPEDNVLLSAFQASMTRIVSERSASNEA